MRRIIVIGCSGSGKTVLSRRLSARTGLPVVHLDRHYWRAGWRECEAGEWRQRMDRLVSQDRWIMDGSYTGTVSVRIARADTVILLDMPRRLCLWRVVKRTLRHLGEPRPEMTPGCPERFDWPFLRYVWNYRRLYLPRIERALHAAPPGQRQFRLRSRRAVRQFLATL